MFWTLIKLNSDPMILVNFGVLHIFRVHYFFIEFGKYFLAVTFSQRFDSTYLPYDAFYDHNYLNLTLAFNLKNLGIVTEPIDVHPSSVSCLMSPAF